MEEDSISQFLCLSFMYRLFYTVFPLHIQACLRLVWAIVFLLLQCIYSSYLGEITLYLSLFLVYFALASLFLLFR